MKFRQTILLLGVMIPVKAQDVHLLDQRVTDYAKKISSAQFLSATRYVPVMIGRGVGTWSSPPRVFEIDGVQFDAFPLNLVSPDYAPVDLILTDSVETTLRPMLTESDSYPGGVMSFRTSKIPDTLSIRARVFGGGETGDVILEEYTKTSLPFYNRNKTGPSGAATVSEKPGRFGYRFMGGGFSYFSVGYADRDKILIPYVDLATFSRPNRHFLGSVELEYEVDEGRYVSLTGGLNLFEAWEQVPFLPTFAFFYGSLGTIRFSARGMIPSVDFFARRDAVSLSMRKQLGTEGGEYIGTVTSVRSVARFAVTEHVDVNFPVDFTVHAIDVPGQNRQLFTEDRDQATWAAGVRIDVRTALWSLRADGRYEKGLSGAFLRSGSVGLITHLFEKDRLEVHVSSIEQSPSFLEMFGEFSTWRFRPSLARNDTFRVRGNSSLKPSRTTGGEVTYSTAGDTRLKTTLFLVKAENPVRRIPSEIIRSAYPGDLVFSGQYVNASSRTLTGLEFTMGFLPIDHITVVARYTFSANDRVREIPRHQVWINGVARVTPTTAATISLTGKTKTLWPEFAIDPLQDDRDALGADGVAPEYWSVDCSLQQSLGRLAMFKNITARIELLNILNRTIRAFPIGVTTDLTVMGYISFGL